MSPRLKTVSAPATRRGSSAPASRAAPHGIRRAVRCRLAGVPDREAEPRAVAEEALHLLGKVPDDHRHLGKTGGPQLEQESRDHGASVDRKDWLRPVLGQRAKPPPLAGSQHDTAEHYDVSERALSVPRRRRPKLSWRPSSRRRSLSSRRARRIAGPDSAGGPNRASERLWTYGSELTANSVSTSSPSSDRVRLGGASTPWSAR